MGRSEDLLNCLKEGGVEAIRQCIENRDREELFLDFKRSSNSGAGRRLTDADRNNLAKAISGFGNSEGGIIVWGVDCSLDESGADIARLAVPIQDPQRFASWLEGAVSGCTVPAHETVTQHVVGESTGHGFVITHIPRSHRAPHQVVGRLQYYIRAGSSFVPTPHMVLAGMFGRVPQPWVFQNYTVSPATVEESGVSFKVGLLIRNRGPGIARDIYLNFNAWTFPDEPSKLGMDRSDPQNWAGTFSFGRMYHMICRPELRLPPEAHTQPLVLNVSLRLPFDKGIRIEGLVGSAGGPSHHFRLENSREHLTAVVEVVVAKHRGGLISPEELRELPGKLLGMGETDREDAAGD